MRNLSESGILCYHHCDPKHCGGNTDAHVGFLSSVESRA